MLVRSSEHDDGGGRVTVPTDRDRVGRGTGVGAPSGGTRWESERGNPGRRRDPTGVERDGEPVNPHWIPVVTDTGPGVCRDTVSPSDRTVTHPDPHLGPYKESKPPRRREDS